jgi:hypothetical protein
MAQLQFTVTNQIITRIDNFKPVALSKNYLYAHFEFLTPEWTGLTATAIFRNSEDAFEVILDANNDALVPWELLEADERQFFVSVFAGDLITANKPSVRVYETGYSDDLESETEPTPSVYAQIVERLTTVEELEVEAETLPAGSAASVDKTTDPETGGYVFTFGIPKGNPGTPGTNGKDGTDGTDGYSPSASVSKVGDTATITITDKDGTTTAQVTDGTNGTDGQPGADGYSPTASVSKSGDTATITITDKNGTTTATVSDGAQGDPGQGVPAGGTTGQVLRKQSNADFSSYWDAESVTDVQINGTTILSQGVANIPIMSDSAYGVAKVKNAYGLYMGSDGFIRTGRAYTSEIRPGINAYVSIVPINQHEATFYGFAKAAGADMKNIDNTTVGIYPEAQKSAISDMLNAPESKSGTTVSITAKSGIRYVCGEVATLDIVVPASGLFEVDFESGSTATVLTTTGATVTWPAWFDPTSLEADTLYEISIQDGRGLVATWPA